MDTTTPTGEHLWLHFTRASEWRGDATTAPNLARGEGCYLWDVDGKRYIDGLAGLYCVQIGYGWDEVSDAASAQMKTLPYATNWGTVHEPSMRLAERLAGIFPDPIDQFFFVNSGSEAVEAAMKLALQYHRMRGDQQRYRFISRDWAYHGTTFGALGVNGVSVIRTLFEPLRPGHHHVPNTNRYRCQASTVCPPCDLSCARSIEQVIAAEGPETVAAVVIEPVQNVGGCFLPPPGYVETVREICDRHGVLLIADEVITGFGRLGTWTGSERHGIRPDIVTFAKGVTSGYAPLGGIGFSREIGDVLASDPKGMYLHGATWGGHPVSTVVALANLDIIEREGMLANVRANEAFLRDGLEALMAKHPLIGDVRGEGYFIGVELVADRATKEPLSDEQSERIMRGHVSGRLKELGLLCRADDRDQPFIQFSPPLVADRGVLGEMIEILDVVVDEAGALV
jgi:adenosylmethionine-8-amino-7-oxononanoate aminotransferase